MTPTPATVETLARLEKLLEKATPGPWTIDWVECPNIDKWPVRITGVGLAEGYKVCTFGEHSDYHRFSNGNAALIAELHAAAPYLLAAAREVEAWRRSYSHFVNESSIASSPDTDAVWRTAMGPAVHTAMAATDAALSAIKEPN